MQPDRARLVLRLALAAVVLAVLAYTQADPDLWGHVRFGRDIITSHRISSVDQYSFTSDRPWVNHEWLSESAMYLGYAAAGGAGLVLLKVALLALMVAAVIVSFRASAVPVEHQDVLVGLLVVATLPQSTSVRPQLFSLALFAWLLAILTAAARKNQPLLLLSAVPMLMVWVNLHGGWIVGAGTLGFWSALGLLSERPRREKLIALSVSFVALLGTLVNPYGWHLWTFLGETVRFGRFGIAEWQPIYRAPTPVVPILWVLVAAAALAAAMRGAIARSLDLRRASLVALLGIQSFAVNRLLGFFAIATIMLLGPPLLRGRPRHRSAERVRPPATSRAAALGLGALGLALAAGGFAQAVTNARCIRIDASVFPEPSVAGWVSAHHLSGRMLTWFNWGEYAIWYFSPAIAVSMDGRRETVYSDETIRRQERLFDKGSPERQAVLDLLRPDYIWLPFNLEVTALLRSDGWNPVFLGARSAILAKGDSIPAMRDVGQPVDRCFPGP